MTKSARWTWPRRSRTAPITSWSGGRSARRPIPGPLRKTSSRRSLLSSLDKLFEQPLEVLVMRQHHALEQGLAAAAHQDRREVLDVDLLHRLGFVLDIDPAKLGAREAPGHGEKARPVGDAGVAPGGAKAGHQIFAIRLHAWPILFMP